MSEEGWLPILYTGYWDVPRVVCVLLPTATLILDSEFRDDIDDYDPVYVVRVLPKLHEQQFRGIRTAGLDEQAVVGSIPVSVDLFDPTRRKAIRRQPLDELGLTSLIDAPEPPS